MGSMIQAPQRPFTGVGHRPLEARRPHFLPGARTTSALGSDLFAAVGALGIVIVGLWLRHGGVAALSRGWRDAATSITQLSGLLASGFGLVGLALVGRPRSVERRIGLDRMFVWHRILGETMTLLVGVHIAAALVAWASAGGLLAAVQDLTGREPYMALATVGSALIAVVTISSLASVRRRMSYETWYFVHLAAYAGFAMSFGHQLVTGDIFGNDTLARVLWIGLHVALIALLVIRRWGTTLRSLLRPLRIAEVRQESPDTVAVRLAGRGLGAIEASAGQFFFLRPLRARWWWQAHPFSLSAAPSSAGLRFTIKNRGDASGSIAAMPLGTRVAVEGPYGSCTTESIGSKQVLFIVGGVGVAPARAMVESMTAINAPVVLFRASSEEDLLHLDELRVLVESRGGTLRTLVGPSASLAVKDPFSARLLRDAVPDLAQRAVVVCGPDRLVSAARQGLRAAGVPTSSVHFERPWW
ncbi:MAG: hypothetical protein F2934_08075 [Actinobacteria bacterium]|uniref:Unannotated protein n=1 Tax=freshwater metagenome TaxID=449393 RepID=A0A6J6VC68_9ZZZZ|nr:hypothetical protein [Actinomycetota bacterium]MSY12273.1 hypothetical protein [Actinomycetota bacterium]MSZ05022.1 hypothetical protein [Actinomycetota bacterium]MTB07069.1 hypothetical protein [Actinomycetota bacterium]